MRTEIHDNELRLYIDRDIYDEVVLHKCFYWYGGNFSVDIDVNDPKVFVVRVKPLGDNVDWQKTIEKIKRDLIDFKLRNIVTQETKEVRELLVAKAFAYFGLNDDPLTTVTDPVGFDPQTIKPRNGNPTTP